MDETDEEFPLYKFPLNPSVHKLEYVHGGNYIAMIL